MTVYHVFPFIARFFQDKIVKAFSAHRFPFGKPFPFESASKESAAGQTERNRRKWMQSARHMPLLPPPSVKRAVSNCHSGDNASSTPPRTRTATRLLSRSATQLRSSTPSAHPKSGSYARCGAKTENSPVPFGTKKLFQTLPNHV